MEYSYKDIWDKIVESEMMTEDDTSIVYYSLSKLGQHLDFLRRTFDDEANVLHTVAIKTNPHPAILKYIADLGYGLEAASFEEVLLAIRSGVTPGKIIFNSPVKTKKEIASCAKNYRGIFINANSFEELRRIPEDADVKIGLRINPCIVPGTNAIFNVSTSHSKFGIPIFYEQQILDAVLKYNIIAFHVHVGSQVSNIEEAVKGISLVYDLAEKANELLKGEKKNNPGSISYINIGGGIPSGDTEAENKDNMKLYVNTLKRQIPHLIEKYKIITEFGQWTHRLNAVCFSRVEYVKHLNGDHGIAYIHLGGDMFLREIYTDMNDFFFSVIRQKSTPDDKTISYDIAGPLCFNGDYVAKNLKLPAIREGDIFVIRNIGANTFGLWSRHCSRTVPKFVTCNEANNKIEILSHRFKPFENYV
jgi:diaminopimelate decarboxylase